MTFDKFAKYTKYAKTQRDVIRTLLTPWILCYITFGSIKALIEPFLGPFQSASHPPFPHPPHLARRAAARPAQPSHTRRTQPLQREARPRRHHELAVHEDTHRQAHIVRLCGNAACASGRPKAGSRARRPAMAAQGSGQAAGAPSPSMVVSIWSGPAGRSAREGRGCQSKASPRWWSRR